MAFPVTTALIEVADHQTGRDDGGAATIIGTTAIVRPAIREAAPVGTTMEATPATFGGVGGGSGGDGHARG